MGYYSEHSLSVIKGDDSLIQSFREESDNAMYAFSENGDCKQRCKWYSAEKELIDFSKKHSETLFLLEVKGEENEDIWKLYVRNGKKQMCKAILTFEEYNEQKLA